MLQDKISKSPLSPFTKGGLGGITGVTLVEVMIALVVLLIVFMGLIQASLVSIDQNVRNEVRDEAVRIAAEYMTRTRATAFSPGNATAPDPPPILDTYIAFDVINRNFRNMAVTYTVTRSVQNLDAENQRIGISVTWTYKAGEPPITHTILSTLRSK